MRTIVLLLLTLVVVLPSWCQESSAGTSTQATTLSGTPIVAELLTELSSRSSKAGDPLRFRVLEDVLGAEGKVAIPKDATLLGTITEAQRVVWKGFHFVPARISLRVHAAQWDGRSLPLDADLFGFVTQVVFSGKGLSGDVECVNGHRALTLRNVSSVEMYSYTPTPPHWPYCNRQRNPDSRIWYDDRCEEQGRYMF